MITRKIEFLTVGGAVAHLVGQDFRQDEDGNWQRADDGATAIIERLSHSVRVRISSDDGCPYCATNRSHTAALCKRMGGEG